MSEIHDALAHLADAERKYVLLRSYPLFAAYYFDLVMADYQGEMVDHTEANRRSLTLIPAGHTKSTTFGKINLIRQICLNPNIRIILTMSVFEDASSYCKSIEHEFTDNKRLMDDFGPFYNKDDWTASQFTIAGRQHNDPHSTLEIFGTGSWKQKGHGCEIVVCDDVVTEETCATPEARRKQSSWFRMAVQTGPRPMWNIDPRYGLKVPKGIDWPRDAPYNPTPTDPRYGQIIVVGTRFNPKDLYDELSHDETYSSMLLDCWIDKEETQPLWPAFWTNEALHAERESLGLINFNKRYRNWPMDESEMVFRREWFMGNDDYPGCINRSRSFGELPWDENGNELDLYKALGFDPASGVATRFAAWPTFALLGFKRGGDTEWDKRYLIDAYRAQVGVEWLIDILLDGNPAIPHPGFHARYKYDIAKIEENGFANLLLTHSRIQAAKHRGVLIEPHITGRNKIDPVSGVKSMEAIFRDGLVDIPYKTDRDRKLADEIIDQFVYFSFDRAGRKKSLTDYVMAFWFAELALRKTRERRAAYRHSSSPFVIANPYYNRGTKSAYTGRKVGGGA
jgi:hypothetical protein